MAGSKLVIVTRQGLLARSGAEWAWTVCSADQRGWSGTAPHWVTTQMLRRRQPLTAELRKRNARARLQKAGIPRDLLAAYIRSPNTLRTHTIRAEEKTAVPRSARLSILSRCSASIALRIALLVFRRTEKAVVSSWLRLPSKQ